MKNTKEKINKKPFGIIYKCTNQINGKVYIGQTKQSFPYRKRQHKWNSENNSNVYFHQALKKYGFENFVWEIIKNGTMKDRLNGRRINKTTLKYYENQ